MDANPLIGRWPENLGPVYGATDTYALTVPWLAQSQGDFHDWGGGRGHAKRFLPVEAARHYYNIDGTLFDQVDLVDNLATRTTRCASILLRHVLENNPQDWRAILEHALYCFQWRCCIVNFRPFVNETHVVEVVDHGGVSIPFLHFAKHDIDYLVQPYLVGECQIQTTHSEHIWYLEKR